MNNFLYSIPTKVYFGKDEHLKIGQILKSLKVKKVLIHFGSDRVKHNGLLPLIEKLIKKEKIKYIELGGVFANPLLSLVQEGIKLCRKEKVDFVLAIGGGSVIDSAKDIANGAANPKDDVWEYSLGNKSPKFTLKKGAILTISAAGSEMSDSCVITNDKTKEKRGYKHPFNQLEFAICNPEFTYSVNKYQTACGIVDIAMHSIERYFGQANHTEVTDSLALTIIKQTFEIGQECIKHPNNYDARANMMWLSSLTHNGLTGFGRTAPFSVHQLEHEISGLYPNVTHGAGLAAIWPSWARYVYKANIMRWKKYSKSIWNTEDVSKTINLQEKYYKKIGLYTSLKDLGVKKEDLPLLALNASRNKTRFLEGDKKLYYQDMLKIYQMAY